MNKDIFNDTSDDFLDSINSSSINNNELQKDENQENDIPQPIKNKINRLFGFTIVIYGILIASGFFIKDFNNIPLIIAFSFFAIYIYIACFGLYIGVKTKGYVLFSGVVIDVKKESLSKNIYAIQFYDEKKDAFISFNYTGTNVPGIETPISLYVSPDEPIKQTENGYYFENYLTYVFSSDYDDHSKNLKAKDL